MEEKTFDLITRLCSELVLDAIGDSLAANKSFIKKLRSRAYEIVLNNRHLSTGDDLENNSSTLLANILEHVYCEAKPRGQWTEEFMEDVCQLIDKAAILAESNSSFLSFLKFLLCLANFTTEKLHHQEIYSGFDMKVSISEHGYKHKSLIKSQSALNPGIFEVPTTLISENAKNLQVLGEIPGTGLKHQKFFATAIPSTKVESRKFEEDVSNGNWIHSKLNNMMITLNSTVTDPRASMHPDEGYVTPDQDLVQDQHIPYIPWEDMYDEDFNSAYSWENFGSVGLTKEHQFISHNRDSVDPISRMIHASDITSACSAKSDVKILRTVSLEELEVAFKNLLAGVESTIFHYDEGLKSFYLSKGLCIKGSMASTLEEYCEDFIKCGNCFKQLSEITKSSRKYGLVFQKLCNNISQYLQCYRCVVLRMPAMKSLLGIHNWLHTLSTQMQFLISLCDINSEGQNRDLLIHLCDKMPVLYRHDLAYVYYYILQSCFTVYFMFLSKWIFEGTTESIWEKEFFIRCNPLTEDMFNRKFWSEGFVLDPELVPNCLKGLESKLLLCGKSMALLKLCASDDPICKLVKKERPEIICCFNKELLDSVEEKFESYKENCKAHCQELFGITTPEPHNESYYADRLNKNLNEIKERQVEERRIQTEKKQLQFNILKKSMEDAKARKVEEKRILLKEEERLIEEAEQIDKLNELRRQEEREKIMLFYSSLSEAADRRRERAEWKVKRTELHDKRLAFLNKENEWVDENVEVNKEHRLQNEESKLLFAEMSLNRYLSSYSPMPGSGDNVFLTLMSDKSLEEAGQTSVQEIDSEPPKLQHDKEGVVNVDLESDEPNYSCGDTVAQNDNKTEWLLALDVAEQAKQNALKFKQRNMYNDYNIITGEEATYDSKFGENHTQQSTEESVPEESVPEKSVQRESDPRESVPEECCDTINYMKEVVNKDADVTSSLDPDISLFPVHDGVEVKTNGDGQSSSREPLISPAIKPKEPEIFDCAPEISDPNLNTSTTKTCSQSDTDIQEIDMIAIHENVKRSVMIPLLTQLELANDAILRLFNKHNLLKHMECIWKYFFLLEGEFAHNLTKNLFEEAQKGQPPSYLLNVLKLNSLLRCAVGTNLDEEFTERLSFYVKEIPSVFRTLDPGMLDCLSLRYKTHWPINIIITDELIKKQDQIFKHLLKLHRVSWALEEIIYLLKDKKLLNSEEYRKVQLYRHVMSHFITAIKQYMTAVVVEKTWLEFKMKFANATSVDMMYDLYQCYVRVINSKCLLGKARVHIEQFLNTLFREVLIFYEVLRSGEWIQESTTSHYHHSNFSRLNHSFDNFKKTADHLTYFFKKMSSTFPNIVQLSTLLSLNDFYKPKERELCL